MQVGSGPRTEPEGVSREQRLRNMGKAREAAGHGHLGQVMGMEAGVEWVYEDGVG